MKTPASLQAAAAAGASSNKKKINSTPILPTSEVDLKDVATDVAQSWAANPAITLIWKTAADFNNDVQLYAASISGTQRTGSRRPGITQSLALLNKKIDAAVAQVKVYIKKEFTTANATAQFARYGIVKEHRVYRLPRDRNSRKISLGLMADAIQADGLGNEKYGTAFWMDTQSQYAAAMQQSGKAAGDVSGIVGTKAQQKRAIKKVLSALLKILQGHYPDTYKEIYRTWGWRKESY